MLAVSCILLGIVSLVQQYQISQLRKDLRFVGDVAASLEVPSDGR